MTYCARACVTLSLTRPTSCMSHATHLPRTLRAVADRAAAFRLARRGGRELSRSARARRRVARAHRRPRSAARRAAARRTTSCERSKRAAWSGTAPSCTRARAPTPITPRCTSCGRQGKLYACACSRREIADSGVAGIEGYVYPGHVPRRRARGPRGARVARRHAAARRSLSTTRSRAASSRTSSKTIGDFVLYRADRVYAYQLAVVVDDAEQGITHVVRGADLLDSTPRQIYLQRLLGLPTPRYAHLPVAVNERGEKLSKQTRRDARSIAATSRRRSCRRCAFSGTTRRAELERAGVARDLGVGGGELAARSRAARAYDHASRRSSPAGVRHTPGDVTVALRTLRGEHGVAVLKREQLPRLHRRPLSRCR